MLARSRSCVLWLTLANSLGCQGDDGGGDCMLAELPCDIRAAGCQAAVYDATACVADMRGGKRPQVRTIDAAELEADLRARVEADPESQASVDAALQLVGLLHGGSSTVEAAIAVAVESLLAYYDNETKQVTVVDRGRSSSPEDDLFTLSHELVHALRDAQSDLGAFRDRYATSTDSAEAVSALAEGEAMVVAYRLVLQVVQGRDAPIDWSGIADRLEGSSLDQIERAQEPLLTALQALPYAYGTRRLGADWDAGGRAVIDDLYAHPDLSLLTWTTPLAQRLDVEPLTCFPTSPPAGYVGEDSDSLGLSGVLVLPIALGTGDTDDSVQASRAWRDDRMVIFRPDGDAASTARAVAWRIRFDSAEHARAFDAAIGCCLPTAARHMLDDRELLIYGASDPAVLQAWSDAGACGRVEDVPVSSSAMRGMSDAAPPRSAGAAP